MLPCLICVFCLVSEPTSHKTRHGMNADGDFCHIIPNWFKTSAYQVKSLVELMTAFIKPKDGQNFLPLYKDTGLRMLEV